MSNVTKLVDEVKGLSSEDKNNLILEVFKGYNLLELKEFKDVWCETFDVSASAPMMMGGPMVAAGDAEEASAEPTEFDVIITEIGDKKIQVIKAVRAITSLGLKEAKGLVDSIPQAVKEKVSKEEAEKVKEEIEASGAKAEIKGV